MPMDLLNLSRVSKSFWDTLMHRSSKSIWKASFANVPDLPSCPPGMAEPRWADLVFGKHCMVRIIIQRYARIWLIIHLGVS